VVVVVVVLEAVVEADVINYTASTDSTKERWSR
jgi:hypothetical protein